MPLPPVTFPTLGWQVIDWMETYLCCGPGDVQGDPLVIDDEEALLLCWIYRVHPQGHAQAGRRLVHRAIYSRPKGRRKSMLAGAIDCAEALGPVRCDGFDAAGDPVGVPVTYPFIRCLATEEEQTGNTYDNIVYMLGEGEAANAYAVDLGLTRTFIREPGGGEIVPSTSGSASKDGGKETKATADETHLYVAKELKRLYRTVARNTGKRKLAEPWMLDTTTMFQAGERSIAELAAERYAGMPVDVAVTKHGVLYDHAQGDEPKRFNDDRSLIKAMRPGYGPAADWIDFERIVKIVRDAEDPEEEAYRYYLNRKRAARTAWVTPEQVAAVLGDIALERDQTICAGFDGSENDDHTALMGCTEDGDVFTIGVWTPAPGDYGWHADVDEAVGWMFDYFDVKRFYCDPPWWIEEVGRWAGKYGAAPKGPVREFWTNVDSKMAVACGALKTAIVRGGADREDGDDTHRFRLDPTPLRTEPIRVVRDEPKPTAGDEAGKPLVQWHFENARKRKVRVRLEDGAEEAHIVRKERPGSPLKIDSVPAGALARRARDDSVAEGEFVKKQTYRRAAWR